MIATCKWSPRCTETAGYAVWNPPARPSVCSHHIILIQTTVNRLVTENPLWDWDLTKEKWNLDLERSDSVLTCQFRRYPPHCEYKRALNESAGTVRDHFISENSCFCKRYHLLNCRITIWGDTGRGEESCLSKKVIISGMMGVISDKVACNSSIHVISVFLGVNTEPENNSLGFKWEIQS